MGMGPFEPSALKGFLFLRRRTCRWPPRTDNCAACRPVDIGGKGEVRLGQNSVGATCTLS